MPTGLMKLPDGAIGSAHPAARTLSTDPTALRVRSVITTADADRAGDVIVPTGVRNVEEFLMNPVVLWAHNRVAVPPIGVCEWLDVQPTRIVAQTRFARGVPFAEDVFRLYEQGILRGWSIGFVPRRAYRHGITVPGPMVAKSAPSGLRVEEWDLLEYSAVPIPENPGALTVALQKGLVSDPDLREWLGRVPDDRGGKWWRVRPAADVLAALAADDVVHSE
jgi:phage head maturation protease